MCLGNTLTDACTHPVLELLEKHCSSGVLFPSAYKGIISYFAGLQQKLPAQYKKRTLIEVLKKTLWVKERNKLISTKNPRNQCGFMVNQMNQVT